MSDLIGPLTAEEWCAFRARDDGDDFMQCCAITSNFRDAVFQVLRMGGDKMFSFILEREWDEFINGHDFYADSEAAILLEKLRVFYGLPEKEQPYAERPKFNKTTPEKVTTDPVTEQEIGRSK